MKQPPNCLKNIKYFFFLIQSFLDVNVDFKRALVSNIAKLVWLANETFFAIKLDILDSCLRT